MNKTILKTPNSDKVTDMKVQKTLVIAALCLGLFLFGPDFSVVDDEWISTGSVQAAPGDNQSSPSTDEDTDDTPSEGDIADFADQYDKDGDGEVDAPDEADDEVEDEPEQEDSEEEADQEDDDEDYGDDDKDDRGDDDDGEENDDEDSEDAAHSGKNRDDIDGEASPDYRLSGYDRYGADGRLRRLGGVSELTPLVEREEKMILDN